MARYVCRHGLIAWRQAGSISGGGGGPAPFFNRPMLGGNFQG